MADSSYQPKVYRRQGGDALIVASGGKITVEAGGSIENGGDVFTAYGVDGVTIDVNGSDDLYALPQFQGSVRINNEDTYSILAGKSGLVYIGTKGSATQVISLPAADSVPGMIVTFICGDAAGEINVDPGAATYKITGKGITVAATKDLKNTAATNAVGDSVTLVSDGVDTWWIIAIQGTWATT